MSGLRSSGFQAELEEAVPQNDKGRNFRKRYAGFLAARSCTSTHAVMIQGVTACCVSAPLAEGPRAVQSRRPELGSRMREKPCTVRFNERGQERLGSPDLTSGRQSHPMALSSNPRTSRIAPAVGQRLEKQLERMNGEVVRSLQISSGQEETCHPQFPFKLKQVYM